MRDSWPKVTLGDVADINPESTDQLRDNDEITYIDLSSVSSAAGISADLFHGSYHIAPGRARRIVRKDDVLISTVRPYLKGFSMVPQYLDGAVASTGFCVLRAKRKQILPGLIWAVVGTDQFVDNLMSKATGSSYPAVRPSDVAAHPIALPPLAEQTRIVDVMSSVDAYIAALQQQAEDARAARNAVLHELLTAGGADWTETTLGDIAEVVGGGTPATSNPAYWDGDIVWLTPTEVVAAPGSVLIDSARKITESGLKNSGARLLPEGTVILTSRASVGFSALAGTALATNQGFQSLIPSAQINNKFLMFWIQNNQQEFKSRAAGSTFKEISKANVRSIALALPPLSEQKRIVETVTAMDDVVSATEQAVRVAQELRSGLLSSLISGDHEIPESYDYLLGAA